MSQNTHFRFAVLLLLVAGCASDRGRRESTPMFDAGESGDDARQVNDAGSDAYARLDGKTSGDGLDGGSAEDPPSCKSNEKRCDGACVDTSSNAEHCGDCGRVCRDGEEVCTQGACQALPTTCPSEGCPLGSFCDLAENQCVAGCFEDEGCPLGQICESRTCIEGCRQDEDCGGELQICEALTCHTGCRSDSACGDGHICETNMCRVGCRSDSTCNDGEVCADTQCREGCRKDTDCASTEWCDTKALLCKPGCRSNADCATNQWCDFASAHTCTSCSDANEPNDEETKRTWLTHADGPTPSVFKGTLCNKDDIDLLKLRWTYATSSVSTPSAVTIRVTASEESGGVVMSVAWQPPGYSRRTRRISLGQDITLHRYDSKSCLGTCSTQILDIDLTSASWGPMEYEIRMGPE